MNTIDVIAGAAVGGFLLTTAVNGNTGKLFYLAKRDKAFLKWGVAVSILGYLYTLPNLHQAVGMIIAMAFLGLFLIKGSAISSGIDNFWKFLGE